MGKENRHFKRIEVTIRIRLKESDTDIAAAFDIKDLSEGGMFVHSPLLWEPGERFDLVFTLPGTDREIVAKGEVARAEDKYLLFPGCAACDPIPGMGIRFTQIAPADRARIKEFLAKTQTA
ncbi:MAG TPA: PilZ domain-containing protein [bacterium]|nr:PilZ domain-containing protein [bacterium]